MLRVKIPFGRLFPAQLDALADVADRFSRGFGHVTTRQNVQLHFLKMHEVEAALRSRRGRAHDARGVRELGADRDGVRNRRASAMARRST